MMRLQRSIAVRCCSRHEQVKPTDAALPACEAALAVIHEGPPVPEDAARSDSEFRENKLMSACALS